MQVKIDKKGRPFLHCNLCGTNVFLRNEKSIVGAVFCGSIIDEMTSAQLVEMRHWVSAKMESIGLRKMIAGGLMSQKEVRVK